MRAELSLCCQLETQPIDGILVQANEVAMLGWPWAGVQSSSFVILASD